MFADLPLKPLEGDALGALVRWWADFVKAGGVVTATEWKSMDEQEKAILIHLRDPGLEREGEVLSKAADRAIEALRANPVRPEGSP